MVIEAGAEEFGLSDQYLANLEREGNPRGASAWSKSSRTATWQRAAARRTEIRRESVGFSAQRRNAHKGSNKEWRSGRHRHASLKSVREPRLQELPKLRCRPKLGNRVEFLES